MRLVFWVLISALSLAPIPSVAQPRALTPLTFADADYPRLALVAAEAGRVGLELTIDTEGRVTNVTISQSSGSPSLDAAAAYFAQSRWRFETNGHATTRVDVTWSLPLTSAAALYPAVPTPVPPGVVPPQPLPPAPPPRRAGGFQQPPLVGNPPTIPAIADDYPPAALRTAEAGSVSVRFLVGGDGEVDDVEVAESSGVRRFDDAAVRIIRTRWRASPATLAGTPVPVWRTASVIFRPITNAPPAQRCHARPIVGEDAVLISARQVNPEQSNNPTLDAPVAQRWIEVQPNGTITDAVLATAKGWMHLSRPLVEALPAYSTPEQRVCWFYDPMPMRR